MNDEVTPFEVEIRATRTNLNVEMSRVARPNYETVKVKIDNEYGDQIFVAEGLFEFLDDRYFAFIKCEAHFIDGTLYCVVYCDGHEPQTVKFRWNNLTLCSDKTPPRHI
jgi:hypothetical protein